MSRIIAFLLALVIFHLSAQPAQADELEGRSPGWYAKVNYTIPAGERWQCTTFESDCIPHYFSYPASHHEELYFVSDWDIGITARVVSQSSQLCLVGVFDARKGKISEEGVFRSWAGEKILNSCTILEKKPCEVEGFVSCVSSKFSTKFPFDLVANLPSSEITCPLLSFFGEEFDLCFIYEALRLFKYPIAAALIIKVFLYL